MCRGERRCLASEGCESALQARCALCCCVHGLPAGSTACVAVHGMLCPCEGHLNAVVLSKLLHQVSWYHVCSSASLIRANQMQSQVIELASAALVTCDEFAKSKRLSISIFANDPKESSKGFSQLPVWVHAAGAHRQVEHPLRPSWKPVP